MVLVDNFIVLVKIRLSFGKIILLITGTGKEQTSLANLISCLPTYGIATK